MSLQATEKQQKRRGKNSTAITTQQMRTQWKKRPFFACSIPIKIKTEKIFMRCCVVAIAVEHFIWNGTIHTCELNGFPHVNNINNVRYVFVQCMCQLLKYRRCAFGNLIYIMHGKYNNKQQQQQQ